MSQGPLCPNLSQKVQKEVFQMANRNLSCVILLGGLSVNLNHLKTAFHTGSSGLYEFTRKPFGLTNAGASFCRLMEMCIGDQQYVTLLFYLDDICIFTEMADQMLDRIEFVFSSLKEFNLKIKPKKSHFFQTSVTFLGHILSADGVSPNPEKVAKIKDWPTPKTPKEVHSFVGLAS